DLQAELAELNSLESRLQPTRSRLEELSEDLRTLNATAEKLSSREKILLETLHRAADLETASLTFKHTKERVEHLDNVSLRRQELETKQFELKSQLATNRGRMEVELEHLKSRIQSLQESAARLKKDLTGKTKLDKDYDEYRKLLLTEAEM